MQMDKTRIAVRERSLFELMDLSLRVCRDYARPIALTLFLGCLPCTLVNYWLVGWMASPDFLEYASIWIPMRYCWSLGLLTFIEAPLAMSLVTVFLGTAVFEEPPPLRKTLLEVFRSAGPLLWYQLGLRGVALMWLIFWGITAGDEYSVYEFFLPIMLVMYVIAVRAVRPYLNEIVLLERNPWRAKEPNTITVRKRNNYLHSTSGGDLMMRWLGSSWILGFLTCASVGNMLFLTGVFAGSWRFSWWFVTFLLPIAFWIVAGYAAVVRFFSYLDLRIRQEGWEVELRMRAEAARMAGPARSGGPSSAELVAGRNSP